MLLVSQKHKLSLLTVLGILFCVISSNLIAKANPIPAGIEGFISYQLPKYEKPLLIGAALAKPIYRTVRDQLFSKEKLSDLSQRSYINSIIPITNFRVNYLELDVHLDSNDNTTAASSGQGQAGRDDAVPATNSPQAFAAESNHTTTISTTVHDENFEEPTEANEVSNNPFFGNFSGSIPEELMLEIFSYLAPGELANLTAVSREWHRLAKDGISWKSRVKHDFDEETINSVIKKLTPKDAGVVLDWKEIYGLCRRIKFYIDAIRNADGFSQLQRAFNLACEKGLDNANTYASYINALKHWDEEFVEIQEILNLAQESGFINVSLYTNYINAAAMVHNFHEAQRGLRLAQESGLIDASTYAAYIFAVSRIDDFNLAQRGLDLAQYDGLVNADVYANYIDVAGRTHHFAEVQRIFKLALDRGIVSPAVYAKCIYVYGFDILNSDFADELPIRGVNDEDNFREAQRIFNLAIENRVTDVNVYSNYLELVCAFGFNDLDEQQRVIELAMDDNLSPDDMALLRGYANI